MYVCVCLCCKETWSIFLGIFSDVIKQYHVYAQSSSLFLSNLFSVPNQQVYPDYSDPNCDSSI